MDQGLLLTILGTVATLVFGVWGVYLAVRRRYPGRILFVKEDCIGLFDSIVRNFPELSVQFRGIPVKENLILLKGIFLNTGSKDISQAMVEQRLRAVLPDGYRWLMARVVAASPAVKADVRVASETSLKFDLGLFRCGELLKWEALAEVPTTEKKNSSPAERLDKDLHFSHRIADTAKIKKKGVESESDYKWTKWTTLFAALSLGLMFALTAYDYSDELEMKKHLVLDEKFYTIRVGQNKEQRELVRVTQVSGDLFRLEWRTGLVKGVSSKEFRLMDPQISLSKRRLSSDESQAHFSIIRGTCIIAMSTVLAYFLYLTWRMYRLRRHISKLTMRSSALTEAGGGDGDAP